MSLTEFYVGIDPGILGGIAILDRSGAVVMALKMPATDRDVLGVFHEHQVRSDGVTRAVLERVSASPQMGVVSAFSFGKGYGALRMVLTASEIPFDEVTPAKWQQVMGCRTGGDKNISKRRAQQLFPQLTITHAIADALLLAEYGRRFFTRASSSTHQEG